MPLMMLVFPKFVRPMWQAVSAPMTSILTGAVAVSLAVGAGSAWAEKTDRDEPLSFAADSAKVDEAKKLNILSGNVEITKGTMVVRSDRVEVRQNPDGTQSASAFGGVGGKAYFSQKRDGLDESIEGEAERVDYDGKTDTVHFSGKAVMRRLRATRVTDEVGGPLIVYDNKTSVFQVIGSTPGPGSNPGRVRGVITPRPAEVAPVAPAAKPAVKPSAEVKGTRNE